MKPTIIEGARGTVKRLSSIVLDHANGLPCILMRGRHDDDIELPSTRGTDDAEKWSQNIAILLACRLNTLNYF